MPGTILISSAYFPPIEYFSQILNADNILVEREENYLKQTYRNRCRILSAGGIQTLTVPVYLGSIHKTPIKDIRIDYSKRWQQVHLRAITASYGASPYFEFYFEDLEKIILGNYEHLCELNSSITDAVMRILELNNPIGFTTSFIPPGTKDNDFRYTISPKKKSAITAKEYMQVFSHNNEFCGGLSIIDLIFNMGPEAVNYL